MAGIEARKTQTKVKHTILQRYLNAWGGIIINGLRSSKKEIHLVYIDCNASYGRFNGEIEDIASGRKPEVIWGSPIIGIQTLDNHVTQARKSGLDVRMNAILIEREVKIFNELKRSLQLADVSQRVRETKNLFSLQDGEIAILCEDSTTAAEKLVHYTQAGCKFSFFVLDPFGPKGIPLPFVHDIIRHQKHDVLLYVPIYDLMKKRGLVPKQDRSSIDEKLLQNYNTMFGHEKWQEIVRALDSDEIQIGQESLHEIILQTKDEMNARNLELDLINCYKESLLLADRKLTVKSIDLHFPDRDRTMYSLFLTTHDPSGALQMNKILSEAGYQEHELRWKFMQAKKHPGQLPLFEVPVSPPETDLRPPKEAIGEHILRLFQKGTLTKRLIYTKLADEPYFVEEINSALSFLKQQKKITYEGTLKYDTPIKRWNN